MTQDFSLTAFNVPLFQISTPILILSIMSTTITVIVILVVIYIIRKNKQQNEEAGYSMKIPADLDEFFLLIKNWGFEKYKTLLSSFLLTDEYTILDILITSLREDKLSVIENDGVLSIVGDGGWRNKHQITELSTLSTRKIYDKKGIIERLVKLGLLEVREAPTDWGRQSHQYRANTAHPLVKSMFGALLNE